MARQTKEERAAERAAQEAADKAAAQLYKAGMPARLMQMQDLARQVGVSVNVHLIETGPRVSFKDENTFDDVLTYDTPEWEVEYVERKLRDIKAEQDARLERQTLAQAAWSKLTKDEQVAVKENIYRVRNSS